MLPEPCSQFFHKSRFTEALIGFSVQETTATAVVALHKDKGRLNQYSPDKETSPLLEARYGELDYDHQGAFQIHSQ
jgi:hypothetical protein